MNFLFCQSKTYGNSVSTAINIAMFGDCYDINSHSVPELKIVGRVGREIIILNKLKT